MIFFIRNYVSYIMRVISVKDDDLDEQNFNHDGNPVEITLVTTEQNVARQCLQLLTVYFHSCMASLYFRKGRPQKE